MSLSLSSFALGNVAQRQCLGVHAAWPLGPMGTLTGVSALSFSFFLRERFGEERCGNAALKELADSCGLSASELHAQGRDLGHVYSEAAYVK